MTQPSSHYSVLTISAKILELSLEFPFAISRGSKTTAQTVVVTVAHALNGVTLTGLGEAVPTSYYGETAESVVAFYDQLEQTQLLTSLDPFNLQELSERLSKHSGNMAAKAGLEMAILDLITKALNIPLYQYFGLDASKTPATSYTIGIAEPAKIEEKTRKALLRGYNCLKVKLGEDEDKNVITLQLIREIAPDVGLRVDANAAWNLSQAQNMLQVMVAFNVEFVEEPLKVVATNKDREALKHVSPLPLMADERCHTLKDIPFCAKYYHAINLKHTKTGGLLEAIRMIHAARAHQLKVMVGCFAESSLSITALAHISPLADYADLDGSLLLANDPFEGVEFHGSHLRLSARPGIGCRPRSETPQEGSVLSGVSL